MGKIFFTADTHFGHTSILQFCNRPWKTIAKMNRALIRNWNDSISENDTVYILGDFVWAGPSKQHEVETIVNKLNGTKILVYGNHDRLTPIQYTECGIHQVIYPYTKYLSYYLFHDPALAVACPNYSICITGHHHGIYGKTREVKGNKIIIDVGVDIWDYKPVEFNEIYETR